MHKVTFFSSKLPGKNPIFSSMPTVGLVKIYFLYLPTLKKPLIPRSTESNVLPVRAETIHGVDDELFVICQLLVLGIVLI